MLKEPIRRICYLTREEAGRLRKELPEHLADMQVCAQTHSLGAHDSVHYACCSTGCVLTQ
jgi:hypothetical protein